MSQTGLAMTIKSPLKGIKTQLFYGIYNFRFPVSTLTIAINHLSICNKVSFLASNRIVVKTL